MVQTAPPSSTNIQAEIQGEISGQVVVGNHNLQIHAEHGALVNVISGDTVTPPRPRPTPVLSLRPRRFRGLLDRKAEIGAVTSAFLSELPVEIHGEAGIGKTSLLRHLAHQPEVERFAAGVVYRSARREAPADLLQFLFDAFYESDVPCKPTDTQVRHLLRDKQALVLLDDLELTREGFEALMDAVPSCTFVVASASRRLWGDVQSIAVSGLPNEDALALVEREMGRPLNSEERDAALALCAAVACNPLRILQEVAAAREDRRPLVGVNQEGRSAPAPEKVSDQALASLSESQRSILGVLAAFGGATVHAEHLAALSGLPDSEPVVHSLQERNLVEVEESRRRLTGNLAVVLEQAWDLAGWRESALAYFIVWAEQHQHLPDSLLEEADCLRELLDWAGATGRWREAQRLGRAMEGALTLSGRWEAWKSVVQSVLQASRALGDQAGAGWAFHQLGSRALCLTDESDARNYLSQALDIRESLGDRLGVAISRHNLEILIGPTTPADDSGSVSGSGSSIQVPLFLKIAGSALLLGLGGLVLCKAVCNGSIPGPTGLSASVASSSEVDLSWSDKSDNEAEFRIERKSDGTFGEVARVPSNSTRFKDTNLAPNTSYTYRLRAASPDGESEYSNERPVLTLPAAPSALSLREVAPTRLELGWTNNSPNPSEFKIERSIDGGGTFIELAKVAAGTTTYSDTAINGGATLYYRVRATNASGDSGHSNLAVWSAAPKPPAAPTLIGVQAASATQVNIRWNDGSDNENGFKIERRAGTGSYRQIALVEANTTSHEDRGLAGNTSYTYRMRAANDAGDSAYTNEVGTTTPPALPPPPSDLTAAPGPSGRIVLSWRDNSKDEAGFYLERKAIGDSYQRVTTMAAGAVSFTDSGLNPQTTYTYRIQAFNRAGGSAFSNEVTITTPALPGRIEVSPTRVRFATVAVGSTATAEVRVTNIGRGMLEGSVGSGGAPFKVLSQQRFSLGPATSLQVIVEFAPAEPGDSTGTLTIKSNDPRRPEAQVPLSGTGKREPVAVQLLSLSLAAQQVIGGESVEGKVSLNGVAPTSGATVTVSSSSPAVRVPSSVVIRAGENTAVFRITTTRVARDTSATISGSLGENRRSEVLKVRAEREPQQPEVRLESLSLGPRVVTGGESSEGKVGLSNVVPAGGANISLSSSSSAAGVPQSVVVRAGESSAVFTIRTTRVARNTRATISASLGQNRRSEVLEVRAAREPQPPEVTLESLSLTARVLAGGESAEGKVGLSNVAPAGGVTVSLSSSNPVVGVPQSVVVRGGESSAVFTIKTIRVARNTRATVSASLGPNRRSELLEVRAHREPQPPEVRLESLALRPDRVRAGQRSAGTVKLSRIAPRDISVAISSSNSRIATSPNSVTVKERSSVATFTVTTRPGTGPGRVVGLVSHRMSTLQSEEVAVTITASLDGRSATAILKIRP